MSQTPLWILGSRGLLGSAVARSAPPAYREMSYPPIGWSSADVSSQISTVGRQFREHVGDGPSAVVWCAGAGVTGTSETELQRETESLDAVLQELRPLRTPVTLFLASSAGGVYGGSTQLPISEASPAAAISAYGLNKLEQESLALSWGLDVGARVVVGRISNLYGPGQSLSKAQGLVSQLCLAALVRQPISIYVSLDTIRDYLFVDDGAQMVVECLQRSTGLAAGEGKVKIISSSTSMSIGGVLAEVHRVVGRPPSVVLVPSERSGSQGRALSFRSTLWTEVDASASTTLPSGIGQTVHALRRLLSAGMLGSTMPGSR